MPKPIPFPTRQKTERPKELPEIPVIPQKQDLKTDNPLESAIIHQTPAESPRKIEIPEETPQREDQPEQSPAKEEMPSDLNEENCVIIGGKKVEIKPTKLKYFRNKGASAYGIIKTVPLHELLTYGKGVIDEKRDADQLLYDFLVSVFDDPYLVRDNYNELDADTIDRICKIFGRLNHIDEKEEAIRKNREAQAKR